MMPKSTERRCFSCQQNKPLTREFFYTETSRPHGLSYRCIECERARDKNPRPLRWAQMTDEQKARKREWQADYRFTLNGWLLKVLNSCRKYDQKKGLEFGLTKEFLAAQIYDQPCFYCKDTDEMIGCDRIDNSKGHTPNNVVPCCHSCNVARNNRFTFAEMEFIGRAIEWIKERRRENCFTLLQELDTEGCI